MLEHESPANCNARDEAGEGEHVRQDKGKAKVADEGKIEQDKREEDEGRKEKEGDILLRATNALKEGHYDEVLR